MRSVIAVTALALCAAATLTACELPTATASTPTSGHARHAAWLVKDTDTSRDGTTNSYSATCVLTDGTTVTGWRRITVSEAAEYALNTGDRCPSGHVFESASCRPDASAYNLHPDTEDVRAIAPIICENGE